MKYRHLYIFLFLFVWVYVGLYLAGNESPTFDEPVHLKAAILYEKGDYNFDPIEPPLFRRLIYSLGQKLDNQASASPTLLPYRVVVVILTGITLCFLLWQLFSQSLFTGMLGSVLLVYNANLMAYSHYFTTDAISAIVSVIAALYVLREYWHSKSELIITSFFVALAASLKVATLALLIPLVLIKLPRLKKINLLFLLCSVMLFVWATYGFRWLPVFNHVSFQFPFGGYLRALKENILFASRGQPIFFSGQLFQRSPWYKTFLVLFLKTSFPLLILSLWSVLKSRRLGGYLLIFFIVILVNTFKPLNFGMRHLLPAEITLVLIASQVKPKTLLNWMLFPLLVLWYIVGFNATLPQPITFTNELTRQGTFTDSDFDWGQGLYELRYELDRRSIINFQLAYFGNVDPQKYLGNYQRIQDEDPVSPLPINKLNPNLPTAISVTCYYLCGYDKDPLFTNRPKEIIAKSFYYFP